MIELTKARARGTLYHMAEPNNEMFRHRYAVNSAVSSARGFRYSEIGAGI